MDRINQLRGEAGDSRDSTLDTSSPPSEAFMSANESSSKYFSLSEVDSTFSISPSKDTTISTTADSERTVTADTDIISTLSPIPKSDIDSYKIGKHIEAANILSGGVNIFDDNDNSYDGDELVIDDNVTLEEEKTSAELKLSEDAVVPLEKTEEPSVEMLDDTEVIPSKDTEVVLQIDGKNVDAIDIGNGLYLYRKAGEEELAAVQIIDDDQQQPSFKFLKVRENTEGNLEVYEEIEVEIPKEVPTKDGSSTEKTVHVPIKDINKVINEPSCNKVIDKVIKTPKIDTNTTFSSTIDPSVDLQTESKSEVNLNGKMMKFNESRKSPLTFTPMTYHSTPNKDGIPLTKTMVDQQLHPSRHSDNIKKTIEVHTDSNKPKFVETTIKTKEISETTKMPEFEASVAESEEYNTEMTVADISQKEVETVNKDLSEVICISSDQHDQNKQTDESSKDTMEINSVSENEDCTANTLRESEVNAEQNTNKNIEITDSNIRKEAEHPICDNITTSNQNQNLTETIAREEFTQYPEKQKCTQENKELSSVNENVDDTNNVCDANLNDLKQNEIENNTNIDHAKNTSVENLLTTGNLLNTNIEDNEVTIVTEVVTNKKLVEEFNAQQTCNKDASQLVDPIDQVVRNEPDEKESNMLPTTETEINLENKNIQETKNEDLLIVSANGNKNNTETDIDASKITNMDTTITQTRSSNNDKQIEPKKEIPKTKVATKPNNCNSAVPFGKWTEANRQEFLNKIKETKVSSNNSNTNQIKQPNDLNRRDVLKKFDSQRQSAVPAKVPDFGSVPKFSGKMDTAAFVNKSAINQPLKPLKPVIPSLKTQTAVAKQKPAIPKKAVKEESLNSEMMVQRRIINSQELIDKTIEGIITRAIKIKTIPGHMKEQMTIHTVENPKDAMPLPGSLDDIEMKMNELHGMSFIERPLQEPSSQVPKNDSKTCDKSENVNVHKSTKIPNLLPFKVKEQHKTVKETMGDDTSDEEIIEHEPITGDIDVSKQNLISLLSSKEKPLITKEPKKDAIITEKDFDKFARRNSITYENCLTVNFDGKEQHNVIQTVVEKETSVKKLSRNELLLAESKAKSSSKHSIAARHNNQPSKLPILKSTGDEESYNKNYQSKVQIAYHSALTAKRNLECPITMIEDKPVKVLYMDTSTEFIPTQLNVQGQELSPTNNQKTDSDLQSASDSVDSLDTLDSNQDTKSQDEIKSKSKHQRKQVLTPVEEDLEIQLIEPSDLGIKISPTKKRRVEEKADKNSKNLVPKKTYLLNRSGVDEHTSKQDQSKVKFKESETRNDTYMGHTDTITAIDNLVKAAELIETQSENNNSTDVIASQTTEIPQNTPIKRGRGRPRKYPLPESGSDVIKPLSPQKKPRLIDSKVTRSYTDSDESSDGEIIKENWTMGKINENIVCPICNKLFRSENVVFKHVKHCTGPSPNRSDSDKSPKRLRNSQDRQLRDSISDDTSSDDEEQIINLKSNYNVSKSADDNADIIVIEDTPIKEKPTDEKVIHPESKKVLRKPKHQHNTSNLICEICGKTFRQLSYLVSHKLQHKNENTTKKCEGDIANKSVFSCEVCKKEFRKLHHLVQHRIIHNPSSLPSKLHRKASSELHEGKNTKTQNDDASAGFRCEPCDKSFRKLHHLVEHRETHDGINKKGSTVTSQSTTESTKSILAHDCDICKKVFKKLQDLLEHKEQHYETSSEKSDDKSVKSSLSTKDIIHECSLCYMVFPNEHSLNKHTVFCLRKKKQSAAKQAAKQAEGKETVDAESLKSDENIQEDIEVIKDNHQIEDSEEVTGQSQDSLMNNMKVDPKEEKVTFLENDDVKAQGTKHVTEEKPINVELMSKKRHSNVTEKIKTTDDIEIPAKIKKMDDKVHMTVPDTPAPKKKITQKDKIAPTVTKRYKTVKVPLPVVEESYPSVESSDDDEVRYMFNPNFKEDESIESKVFMKIRALKRNSLQIERPNSKDLVKRRISLQHPPKMPRLKAKAVETKPLAGATVQKKIKPATEVTIATDSDDSDVKYSFPDKKHMEATKSVEKNMKRQSLAVKRKSLVGIAKRKSLGKLKTPTNKPKKRTAEIEHRCDCGQLFSSAALLSRHTTLAHTPPRIRRRRSPPPDTHTQKTAKPPNSKPPNNKPPSTKPSNAKGLISKLPVTKLPNKPKPNTQSKNPKCDVTSSNKAINVGVATRKSSVSNSEAKAPVDSSRPAKIESNFKSLRSANRGLSSADKMRKLADKSKK